ncbi:UBE4A [Hepatospora eriocheir]|uniref:UBE4A n=1 Tax=Hepatospora eriocheir TaxID=1081669 RepID=A0A1X0QI68_9MICR|nr:UBE4A [Hepatospora eriocheir]
MKSDYNNLSEISKTLFKQAFKKLLEPSEGTIEILHESGYEPALYTHLYERFDLYKLLTKLREYNFKQSIAPYARKILIDAIVLSYEDKIQLDLYSILHNKEIIEDLCSKNKYLALNIIYRCSDINSLTAAIKGFIKLTEHDKELGRILFGIKNNTRVGVINSYKLWFLQTLRYNYDLKEILVNDDSETTCFFREFLRLNYSVKEDIDKANQLFQLIKKLINIPVYKECYMEMIYNYCDQDRAKIKYKIQENADDNFANFFYFTMKNLIEPLLCKFDLFESKLKTSKFVKFLFVNYLRVTQTIKKLSVKEIGGYLLFILHYFSTDKLIFKEIKNQMNNIKRQYKFLYENENIDYKNITNVNDLVKDFNFIDTTLKYLIETNQIYSKYTDVFFHLLFVNRNLCDDIISILYKKSTYKSENIIKSDCILRRILAIYGCNDNKNNYKCKQQILEILTEYDFSVDIDSLRLANTVISDLSTFFQGSLDNKETYIKMYKEVIELENKLHSDKNFELSEPEDDRDEDYRDFFYGQIPFISNLSDKIYEREINRINVEDRVLITNLVYIYKHQNDKYFIAQELHTKISSMKRYLKEMKGYSLAFKFQLRLLNIIVDKNRKLFLNRNVFHTLSRTIDFMIKKQQKFNNLDDVMEFNPKYKELKIYELNRLKFEKYPNEKLFPSTLNMKLKIVELLRKFKSFVKHLDIKYDELEAFYSDIKSKSDTITQNDMKEILECLKNHKEVDEDYLLDCPEEYLDLVTGMLMRDPVILKTSRQIIDKSTFNQIMLHDRIDPFNREEMNEDSFIENKELKEEIEKYLKNKTN